MSSQISDLAFFPASHSTPDERVGNRHEPGDLVDQVDRTACLRLMMPEFFFGSTNQ